jgi:quinol-cytochrome oxidoreductase complex cytochrome b subunit
VEGEPRTEGKRSFLGWLEARVNVTEIVSFLSVFGLLPTELDSRKPLRPALREALSQPLPAYARWPRVLGILAFILFNLLAVTGMMLAFYYQPTDQAAYASVTAIARDVSLGSLVHQVHHWAATLFLIILALRVIRLFISGLYTRGRELIWMAAVMAFVLGTFLDLTGRLLPWDATGYWTTVRAREVIAPLPFVGPAVAFLVGGTGIDSLVLTRFYVLHIAVFPLAMIALFYLHFASVRRVGMSRGADAPSRRPLPAAMYDVLLLVIFLVGVLITFAIVWPRPFVVMADPLSTPPDAHPPWYLLAPHAVLEFAPAIIPRVLRGVLLVGLLAGVLTLPFLDRSVSPEKRNRAFFNLGVAIMVAWVVLAIAGWRLEVTR